MLPKACTSQNSLEQLAADLGGETARMELLDSL